jgi:hypothetical protein
MRLVLLGALVLGIALALLIPLYFIGGAMMGGAPPESATQLLAASPGSQTTIVCEVTSLPSKTLINGALLQRQSESAYTRTSQPVQIQWRPDNSSIVMGNGQDIHQGAVLQVHGRVDAQRVIHADRFVILTGAVSVH